MAIAAIRARQHCADCWLAGQGAGVRTHRPPSETELRRGEAVTWGTKPAAAPPPAARLPKFTPLAGDGATRAFLSVQPPSGIILNDLRLMRGKNGYWVAMPSIKMIDREGNPLLDTKGRPLYRPVVEFKDRTTRDRFCDMVLDLIRAEHPEVLADEGTP
jgi:DNA-binding cell septation regulator SpoVG